MLELLDRARVALHPALRSLGPDLLDDDPQIAVAVAARARALARARGRSARCCSTRRVAAGIGNVVRCEALYALRVDPWAPLGGLSDETLTALLEQSRRLPAGRRARRTARCRARSTARRRCPRCGAAVQPPGPGRRGAHGALVPRLPASLQASPT